MRPEMAVCRSASRGLALDTQDAEILAKRPHELSADRYGAIFAEDLKHMINKYRQ
jgi:hypothetical protein